MFEFCRLYCEYTELHAPSPALPARCAPDRVLLSLRTCSKKPAEVRHSELRDGITPALLELAGKKAVEWALSKQHAVLLIQLVESVKGQLHDFMLVGRGRKVGGAFSCR